MSKILFLDRDGVINIDKGHVYKIEDFEFQDGIFSLCQLFISKGFLVCIVTNQAGIAKGLYTIDDLNKLNKYMEKEFSNRGIKISGNYFCPHHPDDNCDCRKPKPGLILKALKDLNGDPNLSYLIGDKISDIEAGANAGIKHLFFLQRQYEEFSNNLHYTKVFNLSDVTFAKNNC